MARSGPGGHGSRKSAALAFLRKPPQEGSRTEPRWPGGGEQPGRQQRQVPEGTPSAGQACAWQQVSGTRPRAGKLAQQSCRIADSHSASPKPSFGKRYTSLCYPAPRQTRGGQLLTSGRRSLAARDLPSDSRKESLEERVFRIARVCSGLCAHGAPGAAGAALPARRNLPVSACGSRAGASSPGTGLRGTSGGADCTGKQRVAKGDGRFRKRRQHGAHRGY